MKLKNYSTERWSDQVNLKCSWVDEMRRPCNVKLVIERGADVRVDEVLLQGDTRDVDGALSGIAEIAWSRGWRPRGLVAAVANMVGNFKIPPE